MNDFFYNQYTSAQDFNQGEKKREDKLMEDIKRFEMVSTLDEARKLADEILPQKQNSCNFYVGDVRCTVVSDSSSFQICVETKKEFLCYSY